MKNYKVLIEEIKKEKNINEKNSLSAILMHIFETEKPRIGMNDGRFIYEFATQEMQPLKDAIKYAKNYKERDKIFSYLDKLFVMVMLSNYSDASSVQTMFDLVAVLDKYRILENAIDSLFKKEKITAQDVKSVLEIANETTDVFEKGRLYIGLFRYEKEFENLEPEAKEMLIKYINKEALEMVLGFEKLDKDEKLSLEIICDIVKLYYNKDTVRILQIASQVKDPAIAFYAVDSLIELDQEPDEQIVQYIAKDQVYACRIFDCLNSRGLSYMIPEFLKDEQYLAKSSMLTWLLYPTELGMLPDEIQFVGKVKKRKEEYYVYKFKSGSENLSEDRKNVWLVGWANSHSKTFSNFDLLADFEAETTEKTLKNIAKKCL